MNGKLIYNLISTDLKQNMFFLAEGRLAHVDRFEKDTAFITFYTIENKVLKANKTSFTKDVLKASYSDKVIKLILIINNTPISIIHGNYNDIFKKIVKYDIEGKYLSKLLNKNDLDVNVYGNIESVYSEVKPGEIVIVNNLNTIDKYSLYEPSSRICKVLEFKNNKFIISHISEESDKKYVVSRNEITKEKDNSYKLFKIMDFDFLQNLITNRELNAIQKPKVSPKKENPFIRVAKSNWVASYVKDSESDNSYTWCAVNNKTKEIYPISILNENVPKYQFSGNDNDYWIPGTPKELTAPSADMKNFIPFRENLPIFGEIVEVEIGDKKVKVFRLNNIKQNSVNKYIYQNRDITEERRTEYTLKRLPNLY